MTGITITMTRTLSVARVAAVAVAAAPSGLTPGSCSAQAVLAALVSARGCATVAAAAVAGPGAVTSAPPRCRCSQSSR